MYYIQIHVLYSNSNKNSKHIYCHMEDTHCLNKDDWCFVGSSHAGFVSSRVSPRRALVCDEARVGELEKVATADDCGVLYSHPTVSMMWELRFLSFNCNGKDKNYTGSNETSKQSRTTRNNSDRASLVMRECQRFLHKRFTLGLPNLCLGCQTYINLCKFPIPHSKVHT